jgi:hypothetical protein
MFKNFSTDFGTLFQIKNKKGMWLSGYGSGGVHLAPKCLATAVMSSPPT